VFCVCVRLCVFATFCFGCLCVCVKVDLQMCLHSVVCFGCVCVFVCVFWSPFVLVVCVCTHRLRRVVCFVYVFVCVF